MSEASLDPFRGYANALRDELPDAVAVLDAFHVVKLGTQVVDETRRRVQQETCSGAATRTTRSTRSGACCASARTTPPTYCGRRGRTRPVAWRLVHSGSPPL
ncbi:transposase [Monashia sp. NPDC004114]